MLLILGLVGLFLLEGLLLVEILFLFLDLEDKLWFFGGGGKLNTIKNNYEGGYLLGYFRNGM